MSSIKNVATVYLSTALLLGGWTNWMARKEIKEDIRLFIDEPSEQLMVMKYRKYNVRNLRQLRDKPSIQRRYINDCTVRTVGTFLMWPIL